LHVDPRVLATHYTSWRFAEDYLPEPPALGEARSRAQSLPAAPAGSGVGAALRLLAATVSARHVVEIGTGTGVSGSWLLSGMTADGVLTSIDIEAEHQRIARATFAEQNIDTGRTRLIVGRALEVLPRLADETYDLVFIDGDKIEYPDYVEQAARLLRVGGIVAIDNALWSGKVADPAARDEETIAIRSVVTALRTDPRWVTSLLPVGDGLLVGVRTNASVTPESSPDESSIDSVEQPEQ